MTFSSTPLPVALPLTLLNGDRLSTIRWHPSPHCDARPAGQVPRLLVIHSISLPPGEFGGHWIEDLFSGTLDTQAHPSFASLAGLRVSAHCLIRRDGEIVQFVPFDQRAWHAGKSHYQGCDNCNDFSIGIELEGNDSEPYTDEQYCHLVALTRALIQRYPALENHITGHQNIAPQRKTDPGNMFDWLRFYRQLYANGYSA